MSTCCLSDWNGLNEYKIGLTLGVPSVVTPKRIKQRPEVGFSLMVLKLGTIVTTVM